MHFIWMDKEPLNHCNLVELPNFYRLPSIHIFLNIIHINQDPLFLDTTINKKYQEVKYESTNKLVLMKNEKISIDVQKYDNSIIMYKENKKDTLMIPSPIIQEEISYKT